MSVTSESCDNRVLHRWRALSAGLSCCLLLWHPCRADTPATSPPQKTGAQGNPQRLPKMTADEEKIYRALAAPTSVGFVDTQIGDALKFLQEQHGITIQIDEPALAKESLSSDSPINMALSDLTFHSVLSLMFKESKLGFTIENNVLKVTTRSVIAQTGLPPALATFAANERRIQRTEAAIHKALTRKINVNFKNIGIPDALKSIQDGLGTNIFILQTQTADAKIDLNQSVTLKMEQMPVSTVLQAVLQPAKLKYWIEHEVVLVGVPDPDEERLQRIKARKQRAATGAKLSP